DDSGSLCLNATDSAGNVGTACFNWNRRPSDLNPPLFTQNAIPEPRTTLSGIVTETRVYDRGLKEVALNVVQNLANPRVAMTKSDRATVSATLIDSMRQAEATVTATDSMGNVMTATMAYTPDPDRFPPQLRI